MSASVKTVCKKNALKDGLFPIYLRVTINRKSKFYSTPFSCKLIEWNDDTGEFNAKFRNNIVFNKTLRKIKDNASDVIDLLQKEYDTYNLVLFDKYYSKNENKDLTFSLLLEKEVQVLEENGQVSYGNSINDTYSALKKFKSNIKEYKFENIDYQFLADFENFLRKGGAEDGGISVYMRNIRMLYNKAINYKIVQSQYYPFKEFKISKYKKKKIKRALSEKEFQQILNLDVNEIPSARNARYLYIFSYYARGMNFTDLAELKWTDIESGKFNYTRNKTSVNLKIKLPDKPIITEIFDFYKLYRPYKTHYIFPILKKELKEYTDKELKDRKDNVLKYYNKELKKILSLSNIDKNITFYTARHTFATSALRNGVNMNIIKQSLGHKSIKTTENYVEDFADNEVDKALNIMF